MVKYLALCLTLSLPLALGAQTDAEKIFRVSFLAQDVEINPIFAYTADEAQLFTAIHEGLLSYNPKTIQPSPAIADSWEISEDLKTYTFFLRPDAYFSNGDPIHAKDVQASWMAQIGGDPRAVFSGLFDTIKGARAYRLGSGPEVEVGMRALDDKIFEVELMTPTAHFLKVLAHHSFSVLHPAMLEDLEWGDKEASQIITSGPYILEERNQDEILMKKSPFYWDRDEVYYTYIKATFEDRTAEEYSKLYNEGLIDWLLSGIIDGDTLNSNEVIHATTTFSSTYLFFRTDHEALSNPEVRQALILLLPLEFLRSEEHFYNPSRGVLVPPIQFYPSPEGIQKQRKTEALKILADQGFSTIKKLPSLRILLPEYWIDEYKFDEIFIESWKDVVNDVTVQFIPPSVADFMVFSQSDNYDMGYMSWIADYTDPYAFLELFISESELNYSRFNDRDYDKILNEARTIQDRKQRYGSLAKAEAILLDRGVILPLSHGVAVNIIDLEAIDGWYNNPLDIHPFRFLRPRSLPPHRDITMAKS